MKNKIPTPAVKDVKDQIKDPQSAGSRGLNKIAKKIPNNPMRKWINISEAASKGCPVATYDIEVNLKNRQTAIEKYYYGPANPDEPGDYWKKAAKRWGIDEKTAKTMKCANCAAFDVSDKMWKCIEDGIKGDDKEVDAMATIHKADLGYCNFLHFKCAGNRSCTSWVTGGAIDDKDRTQ